MVDTKKSSQGRNSIAIQLDTSEKTYRAIKKQ